jgi:hypothetical protein
MERAASRRGVSATAVTLFGVVAILIGMAAFTALTVYLVRAYQASQGLVESYAGEGKAVVRVYAVLSMENSTDRVLNRTFLVFENLWPDLVKIDHIAIAGRSGSLMLDKPVNIALKPGQAGWLKPSELDGSLSVYDEDFWRFKREVGYFEIHVNIGGSGSSFKSYPVFVGQPVIKVEGQAGIPTVVLIFIHSSTNKWVTGWVTQTRTVTTTPTVTVTETKTITAHHLTVTKTSTRVTTTTTRTTITTTSTPTYTTAIYFTVCETVCSEKTLPTAYTVVEETSYTPTVTVTETIIKECSGTVCQTVTTSRSGCKYDIKTVERRTYVWATRTEASASTIYALFSICGACEAPTKTTTITPTVTLTSTTYKTTKTYTITATTFVTATATAEPRTEREVTYVTVPASSVYGTITVTTTETVTSTQTSTRTVTLYAPAKTVTSTGTTTVRASETRYRGSTTTLTLIHQYPTITTVYTTITISCQQDTDIVVSETTVIQRTTTTTATQTIYKMTCRTGTP